MLTEYYKAATEAAAIAELDSFGIVKLTGNDRVAWLVCPLWRNHPVSPGRCG